MFRGYNLIPILIADLICRFLGSFLDNMMRPNKSNIDQLLEDKDCTLEQLLGDNDILTECKWGNQKVVSQQQIWVDSVRSFDREKVSNLLDYIIQMPPVDASHERGHKFPFLASEIFNCELSRVNDAFFTLPEPEPRKRLDSEQSPIAQNSYHSGQDHADNDDEEEMQTASPERQKEAKDDDEDDFERCNEEPDDIIELGEDGQFTLGKIEEQTQKKSRSKRYEENDELDMNIIDLGVEREEPTKDTSIQAMVNANFELPAEEEKEKEPMIELEKEEKKEEEEEDEEKEIEVIEPEKEEEEDKEEVVLELDGDEREGEGEEEKKDALGDKVGLLDGQNIQDAATASTAPTQQEQPRSENKYELFEKLLSFLDTDEELNPVLCGYFCKLFQVLVGNKAREVYQYIYNHPEVLDLIVKHIYNKSISDILIRLLNVSESVFDEGFDRIDSIRQSFVYKVIERLSPEYTVDDHLNAQGLLSELVEYKSVYQELTSQRCCTKYKSYLDSDCQSSRVNTYILLTNMVNRFNQNESYSRRVLGSFEDGAMMDEDMLQYDDQKDTELRSLVEAVVIENVNADLDVRPEDNLNPDYETTYGYCQKPFGVLRTRCVEFLAVAVTIFTRELHGQILDKSIYNDLLHFIELYPFHNILHAKAGDIFITQLEKNTQEAVSLLEQTNLLKKILDLSKEGQLQKFESERVIVKGYIAYIRKIANKICALQKENEDLNNFLESIPEWGQFVEGDLKAGNDVESRPLASDPRKKNSPSPDDDFEFFFKVKSHQSKQRNDQDEEDDEKNEIDLDDGDDDNILAGKDKEFNLHLEEDQDNDLKKYFSNGEGERQDDQDEQPAPLSLEELIGSTVEDAPVSPEFYGNQFWKLEDTFDLDQLLEDYN